MFCKNCGQQLRDGSSFCVNCGASLAPATVQPVSTAAGQPARTPGAPPPANGSAFCKNCGQPLKDNSRFCRNCGADRTPATAQPANVAAEQPVQRPATVQPERVPIEQPARTPDAPLPPPASADAQHSQNAAAENRQTVENLQKQLADMQVQNQSLQNAVTAPAGKKESRSFPVAILLVGLALLLVAGGLAGYFYFYRPYVTDRDAPRYYTFATNTFLRSSQMAGVEHNILDKAPYGSELIVYNSDAGSEWASVKWNNTKGFMSSAFLLPKKDFYILHGIWGDSESRELISTGKCRVALLNYFKSNGFYGTIDPQICQEVFGVPSFPSDKIWQVFSKEKNSKYNTTYYKRVVDRDSKFTDFAVIITNPDSGQRRFLLFGFSDDETPSLVYEEPAPPAGDIVSVRQVNYSNSYTPGYAVEYR
jgi:hypothetical protein